MRLPFLIRQVHGHSMEPTLKKDKLLVISKKFKLKPDIIIITKINDREIVKRVSSINNSKVFILGDNINFSTDSRNFGWISIDQIIGKVVWPQM